jgi:hypothetical protein
MSMNFLLQKFGLFECILLGVMTRSFIVGPTASDAAVIMTLVAAIVFTKDYLSRNKSDHAAESAKELEHLKNEINALKLDRGIKKISTVPMGAVSDLRRF